ncbi:MAG: tripartite tricarboxylate transporter substrate binding protein [Phaeospirillum sp.]|nr:tripartite tricarboxylate transporter substrate binding protein [Phaeospirillum sp.]
MKLARTLFFPFCLLAASVGPATAQTYPSKPVRLIVPFAPGGAVDISGRLMAQALSAALHQSFIVENRPGAGGLLALDAVAKSEPDGYTLAVGAAGPLTISPSLYKDRGFDPLTQLAPVIWFASTPGVLVVKPGLKAANVKDLLALSKSTPAGLNMASAGSGSINHLMGEYFQSQAGVKWVHIPYKGSSPALTDMMGGGVDVMMDLVPTATPFVKTGKLRALAVTTTKRSRQLPDVPTLQELGYRDFNVSSWLSLLAPKGTPPEIVAKLNAALNAALKSPDMQERLAAIGAEPEGGTPERVAQQVRVEMPRWAEIIRASGAKPE